MLSVLVAEGRRALVGGSARGELQAATRGVRVEGRGGRGDGESRARGRAGREGDVDGEGGRSVHGEDGEGGRAAVVGGGWSREHAESNWGIWEKREAGAGRGHM